jgi:hypothetical protein
VFFALQLHVKQCLVSHEHAVVASLVCGCLLFFLKLSKGKAYDSTLSENVSIFQVFYIALGGGQIF